MTKSFLTPLLVVFSLLFSVQLFAFKKSPYNMIVAADGSAAFSKIQQAFDAVPENNTKPIVIYVKPGIYHEKVKLLASKKNVSLIGESYKNTIIQFDDYGKIANGTDKSYSVLIEADNFTAENITFENTIDSRLEQYKDGGQAVALMLTGDKIILNKCCITGFQDTFYLKANKRCYIKDCIIAGTTDYIFGAGIALFENCYLQNRKDSHTTAANHEVGKNKYGFVFKNCVVLQYPGEPTKSVSLGRPWGAGANVVFINSYLGSHIKPEGWAVWTKDETKKGFNNWQTTFFAELDCFGPGSANKNRLDWTKQLSKNELDNYSIQKIFAAQNGLTTFEEHWKPKLKKTKSILPKKNTDEKNIIVTF